MSKASDCVRFTVTLASMNWYDQTQRTSVYLTLFFSVLAKVISIPLPEPCHQIVTIALRTQLSIMASINKWRWDA